MPAVVRGGRRQNSSAPKRGAPSGKRGGAQGVQAGRNASGVPGKFAAVGRLDLSPRAVVISILAGVVVLAVVLATGARAERIGASFSDGMDSLTTGMGLSLNRVRILGASAEATPSIQRALGVQGGEPITGLDLTDLQQRVEAVGWVKSARITRMLPDTLVVDVVEHQRLAVWQIDGQVHLIDAEGRTIPGADPGRYPQLPLVVGRGADLAAADLLPLLTQRPSLYSRIDAMVRVDERRWDLRLKDGSLIQLPAVDQDSALIRLDAMDQRERLLDLGFTRVDLRTPEAMAFRPAEPTAETVEPTGGDV